MAWSERLPCITKVTTSGSRAHGRGTLNRRAVAEPALDCWPTAAAVHAFAVAGAVAAAGGVPPSQLATLGLEPPA